MCAYNGGKAALYDILVAVELGGMVSAESLVEIRAVGAVEARNVEHTVVLSGVGEDTRVDGVGGEDNMAAGTVGRAE